MPIAQVIYTTIGPESGCCGHRHRSVREAGRCLAEYRRRELSDRRVVAVAADGPWPPTEGRYLNDAELDALYEDDGTSAACGEQERLIVFAAGVAADVAAVRRVADALHRRMDRGRTRARHDRGCRGRRGWLPCHWTGARDRRADPGLYLCRSPAAFVTSCRCERTLFGLGRCRRPRVHRRRSPRSSPCSASPDGGAAASITASAWSKATVSSSAVRAATILCVLRVFALLRSCLHVVGMRGAPRGLGGYPGS